jgi:hypothetical protein
MNPKCLLAALLCLFYSSAADAANDSSFARAVISEATNLPLNGWNKTLLLRNGNTIVLHLAPLEKMIVKVFDTAHREISSVSQYFKIIGEASLRVSSFKGFYDIDGIPTLFMTQSIERSNCLLRIRFDPETGKLVDEKIVFESPGAATKEFQFYVSKDKKTDDYAVFCFNDYYAVKNNELSLPVLFFNNKHQLTQKCFFKVPANYIFNIKFAGFDFDKKNGAFAFIAYYTSHTNGYSSGSWIGRLYDGDTLFTTQQLLFKTGHRPYYAFFRYNEFSKNLNLVVACSNVLLYDKKAGIHYEHIFNSYAGVLADDMSVLSFKQLDYKTANRYKRGQGDSSKSYDGIPMRMYTNKFGMTTLLSEHYILHPTYKSRPLNNTSMGNICLTRLNDEGEETTGLIIPKKQRILNALFPDELALRGTTKYLFRDENDQAYDNQFPSFECLSYRNTNYVLVNDYPANMDKALTGERETVMNYRNAEAICYRINADDQLEWQYLFGTAAADESRSLMIESIDMRTDERKFCSLVSVRKGKKVQLHLAWCALN